MTAPAAILFDYGGVLTEVRHVDEGFSRIAAEIVAILSGQGLAALSLDDVEADLRSGNSAYEAWKQSQSRFMHPRELAHEEFIELVVADWPEAQRKAILAAAGSLCEHFEFATLRRPAKPDAREVLLELRRRGVRTALVCNCLAGDSARRQMRIDKLDGLLDVELFSDETGIRKPNPDFMLDALIRLDAAPAQSWFVGDKLNRDILGARRAGMGKAVLMSSPAGPGKPVRGVAPDVVLDSLTELLSLM
ncbi:MAG: HAD family hydrolase [Acidothermaceae bacterium]